MCDLGWSSDETVKFNVNSNSLSLSQINLSLKFSTQINVNIFVSKEFFGKVNNRINCTTP